MKISVREFLACFAILLLPTSAYPQASSGGQTRDSPSGFTTDTLKAYLDSRLEEADKRYDQRFQAQQKALEKSDAATEKRFESVNEFRNQLRDQNLTFIARSEALSLIDSNSKRIDTLSKAISDKEANGQGSAQVWDLLAAGVLLFCTVIGMIVGVGGFIFVVITRKRGQLGS